ncbi:uncharacterized protein BJ171DRAFT_624791 [Polychytrium aggregatum]|uniref:uncharacterized protein n=1 Tax=Polychytrium aggregatum TaxID=110093 RepID=UPI0022FE51C7|nr:uncharacterized protein BJ171DRAFT_624791 [Polychytrium aggregatum]KAI9203092.1 hypothetical protein BJ171DRAFT_624791 [Polychytrium aggregatum]
MKTSILQLATTLGVAAHILGSALAMPACGGPPAGGCVYGSFDSTACVCQCIGQSGGGNGYCPDPVTGACTWFHDHYHLDHNPQLVQDIEHHYHLVQDIEHHYYLAQDVEHYYYLVQDAFAGMTPTGWASTFTAGDVQTATFTVSTAPSDVVFGSSAVVIHSGAGFPYTATYTFPSAINANTGSSPRLAFFGKGGAVSPYGWQNNAPQVTITDSAGRQNVYIPTSILLKNDNVTWTRIEIALGTAAPPVGFTGSISSQFDYTHVASIGFTFDVWDYGFQVTLNGLVFDDIASPCSIYAESCPGGANIDPISFTCPCPLGYTGSNCAQCAPGFQVSGSACILPTDGTYSYWPNAVSYTNSDAWLAKHHAEIQLVQPKVLILNFANPTLASLSSLYGGASYNATALISDVVLGLSLGSKFQGYLNPNATAQFTYQVLNIINLRDGEGGRPNPATPPKSANSALYPRNSDGSFDYSALYSSTFAPNYGYSNGNGGYYTLCDLFNNGIINELWFIASDEGGLSEWTKRQRLLNDRALSEARVATWAPTRLQVGFVNYARGPGCYIHSHGHGYEHSGGRLSTVPKFQEWLVDFANLNLDIRYGVPFQNQYYGTGGVLTTYPTTSSAAMTYFDNATSSGTQYSIPTYDARCGNVHYPPNAFGGYNYTQDTLVQSSCQYFGQTPPATLPLVNQQTWSTYVSAHPNFADCGGHFLIWWYSNMPWYGSGKSSPRGPMLSPGPFLFY